MALNVERLTLGEVAKIEELSGQPISAIGEDDKPKGLALAAMAFVAKRREDPKFTWNAAQNLTFDEANEILGLTEGEDEQESEVVAAGPLDSGSETPESSSPNRAERRATAKRK